MTFCIYVKSVIEDNVVFADFSSKIATLEGIIPL